jgi:3-hydroxyisobutyrate dehydrogenase
MARIDFLGVGKMGLPMAGHLSRAGHAVAVADPSPERMALAAQAGLAVGDAHSLAQAAFVISSLPHDAALLAAAAQALVAEATRRGWYRPPPA